MMLFLNPATSAGQDTVATDDSPQRDFAAWHEGARVLSPARPDAYPLFVALDERQMSERPQPCEVLPRRSGGHQAGQGGGLDAKRAA